MDSSTPFDQDVIAPEDEIRFDRALRPTQFQDFTGQPRTLSNLSVAIRAARDREEALDHVLFSGLPGLGKTTLASLVSNELGVGIKATSGPVLERPGDLAGVLTNLKHGEVLFIDEIHRLPTAVEEYLYSAMEDYSVDIVIDKGPNARSVKLPLEKFTLIGATTREGLLTRPLRERFGIFEKLELYALDELETILARSAGILGVRLGPGTARAIAIRSRGTPRIVNRFLRRVRDLAQVQGEEIISQELANEALNRLGVDERGLQQTDRKILEALIRSGGGPVGLKTLGIAAGEEPDTIEEVYEPFLVQQGLILRTPRGRVATDSAYELLAMVPKPHD